MKNLLTGILLLLFTASLSAQQLDKVTAFHVKGISFSQFCSLIFNQTSVRVYYQEKWVNKLVVTLDMDNATALSAVSEVVKGTGLEVSAWHGNLVVLPGEKLLSSLPPYLNKDNKSTVDSNAKVLTASEERYMTSRSADVVQILRIGRKGAHISGVKASIMGRILDEETGEPIFSATVYIAEIQTGAASDINGFIRLTLKPGNYNATFQYMGYQNKKYQFEVLSDGEFTVSLKKSVIEMKEVEIYGDRQMNIRAKDPGLDKMSIKAIRELPMMMGERDILKVSTTLPGIVSVGEGAAGLNVRGGGSDQNAFYINKIPIYNTSHLFGFFPAFNADIIKDFSIYKGFIPAQYGGHLSSVLNIMTRQGNRKHFTARGGINPVTANLVVEGPLKKDVSSYMLSARASYSDWILQKINDPVISTSSAAFNDLSGSINYDFDKSQLAVFGYHSFDRFSLSNLTDYSYSNNGISATFSHNFGKSLRGEFSLVGSQYAFSTTNKEEEIKAFKHDYKLEHYEFRSDFKHTISDKNSLEYGIGLVLYRLDRGTVVPYGENSLRRTVELGTEQANESSIYISDSYDIFPWLNLTAGGRYALYMPTGPKTVYEYAPGGPKEIKYIVDSMTFNANEPIIKYHEPDLRMAMNIKTDDNGSIKLAFNQMHQNLFMLSTTTAIAPSTQWKLADYHVLPSKSNQYSAGVFRTLGKSGVEASAEMFYKQTTNYPEFKDGANFLENALVETTVLQGDQKAYGLELFVKRSLRKFEGWVSYTYSRSLIKVDGPNDWDKINQGEEYPASYDIPHSLNVVLNYHLKRRLTFASIFTYQTGKPVTYPVSVYYYNGLPVLDYSKRNAYRIPDYVRFDFSVTIEGNLKKQKFMHSSLIFSVYNMFGRDNAYSVYYKTEDGFIRSYKYSVIGVPIFTATWLFKLGNYVSE
jgi:hypothetical protein